MISYKSIESMPIKWGNTDKSPSQWEEIADLGKRNA